MSNRPRIHDLITLLNKVEKYVTLMVEADLLNQLNELPHGCQISLRFRAAPRWQTPQDLAQEMYCFALRTCETIEQSME